MSRFNMTDMKQKDMVKLLEKQGWTLKRSSKHLIYCKNNATIAVTHSKIIKRNTVRQILKTMESEQ